MVAFMSVTSYPGCNIKIHTSNQRGANVCISVLNKWINCSMFLVVERAGSMKLGSRTEIMNICTFFHASPAERCFQNRWNQQELAWSREDGSAAE